MANIIPFPGPEDGKQLSDYDLVLANFRMKLEVRCCPKSIRIRFGTRNWVRCSRFRLLKVSSLQSDWPRNRHYRRRHQRRATGNSWRGTVEETEVIHILLMNEMLDLYDERRELKGLRHRSNEQYQDCITRSVRRLDRGAMWCHEERNESRKQQIVLRHTNDLTKPN